MSTEGFRLLTTGSSPSSKGGEVIFAMEEVVLLHTRELGFEDWGRFDKSHQMKRDGHHWRG